MSPNQTPDHSEIYAQHADRYELLVSREDKESNIPRKLREIENLEAKDVIELGAGTGRLTRLLAPTVRSIYAFDASPHMLEFAAEKLRSTKQRNWGVGVADHRALPIADQTADTVISGWSIAYLVVWNRSSWEKELRRGLSEIKRILRPGGSVIILETLGTGRVTPQPPEELVDYYAFLENEGFASTWIRTDYRFRSKEEAEEVVQFFFGDSMLDEIIDDGSITLPECTGFWWKRFD
jgi:ubiquinone/menaquinone biosynthesis C-methylase UbiE